MNKFTLSIVVWILISSASIAQVTIGSDLNPMKGALLDLKEFDSTSSDNTTANKGLLIPRVDLTSKRVLTIAPQEESDVHIGTVVYNLTRIETSEQDRFCPGLHVWSGNEWSPLTPYAEIIKAENLAGPQSDLVDNRDGEIYHTARFYSTKTFYTCDPTPPIIIDAGIWTTQNLRTTVGLIHKITNNYLDQAYYNSGNAQATPDRLRKNGKLYAWAAATNQKGNAIDGEGNVDNPPTFESNNEGYGTAGALTESKRQGLCPEGWHLPTHTEWITLQKALMLQPELYSTQSSATEANIGNVFKSAQYGSGNNQGTSKAANKGGFDGLLCGFANWNVNTNKDYDISAYWWSSSSIPTVNAYRVSIESDTFIFGANGGSSRNNMLSVRCVKN